MKKLIAICASAVLVLGAATPSFADDRGQTALTGIANVTFERLEALTPTLAPGFRDADLTAHWWWKKRNGQKRCWFWCKPKRKSNPGHGGDPKAVPEIDAAAGLAALSALGAAVAIGAERRRRRRGRKTTA